MDNTKSAGCNERSGTNDAEFTTNDILGGEMLLDKEFRKLSYERPILVCDRILYESGDRHVLDDDEGERTNSEVMKQ